MMNMYWQIVSDNIRGEGTHLANSADGGVSSSACVRTREFLGQPRLGTAVNLRRRRKSSCKPWSIARSCQLESARSEWRW